MVERCFPGRPQVLQGLTQEIYTPLGTAYVTVNYYQNKPVEVFVTLGKTGSTERSFCEALARIISISLQHGVPMGILTRQLRGISSDTAFGVGPQKILSVPDAVGRVLEEAI